MFASFLFTVIGLIMVLFGLLQGEYLLAIVGVLSLSFTPIFLRSFIYFIKPKTFLIIQDGVVKTKNQEIELSAIKGYLVSWAGLSSYLHIIHKDRRQTKINLYNTVELEDFQEEFERYIPYMKSNAHLYI